MGDQEKMSNTIAAVEGAPPCLISDEPPKFRWREEATVLKAARVFGGARQTFPSAFQSYSGTKGFPFQRKRGAAGGGAGGAAAAAAAPKAAPPVPPTFVDEDGDYLYAPCTPPPEIEEQK